MNFAKFTKISPIIAHLSAISSTINTPTYKLAKFLVPILKALTSNEYAVKHSFAFAEEIIEQDSEFLWES